MNERQPVDDLFARVLRDAEAEPPQVVWDGIMEERGALRRGWLLLKRRWGLLVLILLFSGIGTYEVLSSSAGKGRANNSGQLRTMMVSSEVLAGSDVPTNDNTTGFTASASEHPEFHSKPDPLKTIKARRIPNSHATSATGAQSASPAKAPSHSALGTTPDQDRTSALTSIEEEARTPHATMLPPNEFAHMSVERILFRNALADHSIGGLAPVGLSAPPLLRNRTRWWVGLDVGAYAETRKWHGGDPQLAEALNGTESAHPLWGTGLSVGMVQSKGWGLSVGIMYCAGHSEFRHLDHVLAPMDSLVPYVVTFNNEVIASYTETVSVLAPAQQQVSVENRYSTLRIPVEASWQHSVHRWKYRAALGSAVEFNTLRSGVTLENGVDGSGLATVDAGSTNMKRTTVLITGSAGLDVGYALTEDWMLWAGPSYVIGLFPLSPTENYPYAMPERSGFHVRLCYMLRSHE